MRPYHTLPYPYKAQNRGDRTVDYLCLHAAFYTNDKELSPYTLCSWKDDSRGYRLHHRVTMSENNFRVKRYQITSLFDRDFDTFLTLRRHHMLLPVYIHVATVINRFGPLRQGIRDCLVALSSRAGKTQAVLQDMIRHQIFSEARSWISPVSVQSWLVHNEVCFRYVACDEDDTCTGHANSTFIPNSEDNDSSNGTPSDTNGASDKSPGIGSASNASRAFDKSPDNTHITPTRSDDGDDIDDNRTDDGTTTRPKTAVDVKARVTNPCNNPIVPKTENTMGFQTVHTVPTAGKTSPGPSLDGTFVSWLERDLLPWPGMLSQREDRTSPVPFTVDEDKLSSFVACEELELLSLVTQSCGSEGLTAHSLPHVSYVPSSCKRMRL